MKITELFEQGEFVAIIGLSGAGKSTLIRTINRMHDITGGTLTVDGIDVFHQGNLQWQKKQGWNCSYRGMSGYLSRGCYDQEGNSRFAPDHAGR